MKPDTIAACYKALRLPHEAGPAEVKRAFHALAARYHPDVNPNNPFIAEQFKTITRSYEMLKDHLRRSERAALPEPARPHTPPPRRIPPAEPFIMPAAAVLPIEELRVRLRFSDNRFVRFHAVRGLSAHKSPESAWLLVRALSDPDGDVRREAIRALGALRAEIAVMPLIYAFRGADFYTRGAVVQSLEMMDTPLSRKFLRYVGAAHQGGAGGRHEGFNA